MDPLAALLHRGWAPAVLAALHEGRGGRVAALSHLLGIPPGTLRPTLEHLRRRGLARRNPGYGHPLRPEWVLTAAGERAAPACAALLGGVRRAGLEEVARRKWALPILLALLDGRDRFAALGGALPGVSPRALAQTLRRMEAAGAVRRRVLTGRPPRVLYAPTAAARPVLPALHRLADAVHAG